MAVDKVFMSNETSAAPGRTPRRVGTDGALTTVENGTFSTLTSSGGQEQVAHAADALAASTLRSAARADSTKRCYAHDREDLKAFLITLGLPGPPVTPDALAAYVGELLTQGSPLAEQPRALSVATAERRLAAARTWHLELGLEPPSLVGAREVIRGFQRTAGVLPAGKAAPIGLTALRALLHQVDLDAQRGHPARAVRDRALLLLGFSAGTRRSELVGIQTSHIRPVPEGLLVSVLRAKTRTTPDVVPIGWAADPAVCPVRAVLALLDALVSSGLDRGALFHRISTADTVLPYQLKPAAVGDILRRLVEAAQLPVPEGFRSWSPHGLRRGMVSEARKAGADLHGIAALGGWSATSTSLSAYISEIDRWGQHPLKGVM
jgi:site-specific recombinase XerD